MLIMIDQTFYTDGRGLFQDESTPNHRIQGLTDWGWKWSKSYCMLWSLHSPDLNQNSKTYSRIWTCGRQSSETSSTQHQSFRRTVIVSPVHFQKQINANSWLIEAVLVAHGLVGSTTSQWGCIGFRLIEIHQTRLGFSSLHLFSVGQSFSAYCSRSFLFLAVRNGTLCGLLLFESICFKFWRVVNSEMAFFSTYNSCTEWLSELV